MSAVQTFRRRLAAGCAAVLATALLSGCGPTETLDPVLERATLPPVFGSTQDPAPEDEGDLP